MPSLMPVLSPRTEDTLGELLKEINAHHQGVRYEAMANIIANHCQSEGTGREREREIEREREVVYAWHH